MNNGSTDRPLDDADAQAEVFGHVRHAHAMESTEDYVELIGDLIDTRGEERLGISQPSAGKTIARLQRDGFVTSEPFRSIFLTKKGRALAERTRARHDIVYRFFVAIGVGEETARRDSEGVEHHVSDETLAAFERIIETRSGDGARSTLGGPAGPRPASASAARRSTR